MMGVSKNTGKNRGYIMISYHESLSQDITSPLSVVAPCCSQFQHAINTHHEACTVGGSLFQDAEEQLRDFITQSPGVVRISGFSRLFEMD
jgi:hypothetical protein